MDSFIGAVFGALGIVLAKDVLGLSVMWGHVVAGWRKRDWFHVWFSGFMFIGVIALTLIMLIFAMGTLNRLTDIILPLWAFFTGAAGAVFAYYVPLFKTTNHGEMIPRGYGVAWMDYGSGRLTCMPVPLHLIVRWCRIGWLWIKYAGMTVPATPREAYHAGYRQAVKDAQDIK